MEDTEYSNAEPNLVWNVAQTDIVMQGVKNEASTKAIMRNLKDGNVFAEGKFPTRSSSLLKFATVETSSKEQSSSLTLMNFVRKYLRILIFLEMTLKAI